MPALRAYCRARIRPRHAGTPSRRLANAALVAAVPNLLAPAYLAWPPAAWTIPAGRFPGLIITAVAGVQMAKDFS